MLVAMVPAAAQLDYAKVEVATERIADGVYVLTGAGGEIVASRPTREFDDQWGNGYIKPDRWVSMLVAGLRP